MPSVMDTFQQDSPLRDYMHYFVTEEFSDAVVHYSGREQKVHRLVLAQNSDYFSALFLGPFRETLSGSIDLSGDDPAAVGNLLAHLYGHEVVITGISCSEGGYQVVRTQIETFITATKYLVPSLCAKIEAVFADNLARLLECNDDTWNFTYVDKIARMLYIDHEVAGQSLQAPLVALLVEHATELTGNTEFKELNMDVPELAFHLLTALAQTKKTSPIKCKKRKY